MSEQPDLHTLLSAHYPLPKYSIAFEVPDGTSVHHKRSVDAVAIGCWQSVGIQLIGHEIKVSRSDWQREMQDFTKCEAWKKHCNLWYLVAEPGVAKLEELPPSWGLLERAGSGLKVRKPSERVVSPEPISLTLLAAIMRTIQSHSESQQAIAQARKLGYTEGVARAESSRPSDRYQSMFERLTESIADFTAKSGVEIDAYDGEHVGDQFKAFCEFRNSYRSLFRVLPEFIEATSNFHEVMKDQLQ